MPDAQILLIRHCLSSGQAPEAPLSPAGAEAAERLADRLDALGVDAAYSSPFARAVATIEPYARRQNLPITIESRLAERRLAPTPLDDWLEAMRQSFADDGYRVEGGESLAEAGRRGLLGLAAVAAGDHRLPGVATHGAILSAMLRSVDPSVDFHFWRGLANPDLFLGVMRDGRLVSFERLAS
jgi:2,3-bisphosphoglycerate-dependent phosphoglycerate mutase